MNEQRGISKQALALALALFSGFLYPVGLAVPYAGITAFLVLLPLLIAISGKSPRHAFLLGLLMGGVANFIGHYWLIGTLTRFGGFYLPASIIIHLFLSVFFGLMFGIGSWLTVVSGLTRRSGIVQGLAFASIWTGLEFLYPFLFPYGLTNFLSEYVVLVQVYDLLGMYLLSFVLYFVNFAIYTAVKALYERRSFPAGTVISSLALVVFVALYGVWRIGAVDRLSALAPKIKIGIVQADFDTSEKKQPNEKAMVSRFRAMSEKLDAPDLVIWPETAVQSWVSSTSNFFGDDDGAFVPAMKGAYFLSGGLSYEVVPKLPGADNPGRVDKYNMAFLSDYNGVILGRYRKIKLLLFGEYLPFSNYFPAIKKLSPASRDFTPGRVLSVLDIPEKGARIGPLICYEDILPSFGRKFAAKGANILVNLTNDAWFGDSFEPYQHLKLATARAVETRRYLVRSTNTGISAVIDPVGRVVERTNTFEEATIETEVGLIKSQTLYTRVGDVFPWFCVVAGVLYSCYALFLRKYIGKGG